MTNVLFALDDPHYHSIHFNESSRFRGAALALDGDPVTVIRLCREDRVIAEAPVNLPCSEFSILAAPNAATSRFEFFATIEDGAPYQLWGGDGSTRGTLLFELDPAAAKESRLRDVAAAIAALPVPGHDLLVATQGGGDANSYRDGMISGFFTAETLLTRAGVPPESIRSVLDLGCGTGRLLAGWHLADPTRRTVGIDINGELIAWNNTHLRSVGEWYQFTKEPPIGFDAGSFDLILVTSVFTHLPLAWQRAWVLEIERLLTPNGVAMLTLNGPAYVNAILDERGRGLFQSMGYAEGVGGVPGANGYSTFHSTELAVNLLQPLVPLAIFPMGRPSNGDAPAWFPMAAWQDVYVLQKRAAARAN